MNINVSPGVPFRNISKSRYPSDGCEYVPSGAIPIAPTVKYEPCSFLFIQPRLVTVVAIKRFAGGKRERPGVPVETSAFVVAGDDDDDDDDEDDDADAVVVLVVIGAVCFFVCVVDVVLGSSIAPGAPADRCISKGTLVESPDKVLESIPVGCLLAASACAWAWSLAEAGLINDDVGAFVRGFVGASATGTAIRGNTSSASISGLATARLSITATGTSGLVFTPVSSI